MEKDDSKPSCLSRCAYGFGFVAACLCSRTTLSYTVIFFHLVLHLDNDMAGYMIFIAKVCDAIATCLIAVFSDKFKGCGCYPKWKSVHLIGTMGLVICSPLIFYKCLICANDYWKTFLYYTTLLVIFHISLTISKLSQLALIPALSTSDEDRTQISALRNGISVACGIQPFIIALALWKTFPNGTKGVSPGDSENFLILAIINASIGFLASVVFHIGVKEPTCVSSSDTKSYGSLTEFNYNNNEKEELDTMTNKSWLKESQFYQVALLYLLGKSGLGVALTYLPLYITKSLMLPVEYIATVPLIVYISSMASTFLVEKSNEHLGRKITFALGPLSIFISSIWIWLGYGMNQNTVYLLAVILGFHHAVISITVVAMASDLIGTHHKTGGFVYGIIMFFDRLLYGTGILFVQKLFPCRTTACCQACAWFYRYIMAFFPGILNGLAVIVLLTLIPVKIGKLSHDKKKDEPKFLRAEE